MEGIKLIYILSSSHSGSTLLSLILGTNDHILNLGEITSTFNRWREKQHTCTCGSHISDCLIWKDVHVSEMGGDAALLSWYLELLEKGKANQCQFVVDASKNLSTLDMLVRKLNVDIKVIFLLRDVRAYISSIRKKSINRSRNIKSTIYLSYPYLMFYWFKNNKKCLEYLKNSSIDFCKISYEELCFNQEYSLNKISKFLAIPFVFQISDLSLSNSHILRGNGMRFRKKMLNGIRYDYSWMNDEKHFHYPLIMNYVSKKIINISKVD